MKERSPNNNILRKNIPKYFYNFLKIGYCCIFICCFIFLHNVFFVHVVFYKTLRKVRREKKYLSYISVIIYEYMYVCLDVYARTFHVLYVLFSCSCVCLFFYSRRCGLHTCVFVSVLKRVCICHAKYTQNSRPLNKIQALDKQNTSTRHRKYIQRIQTLYNTHKKNTNTQNKETKYIQNTQNTYIQFI